MVRWSQEASRYALAYGKRAHKKELLRWTNALYAKRKLESTENWIKRHLWGGFAIFHWSCFGAFLRSGSEEQVENVVWKQTVWRRPINRDFPD